jgi:hypothetical protein
MQAVGVIKHPAIYKRCLGLSSISCIIFSRGPRQKKIRGLADGAPLD